MVSFMYIVTALNGKKEGKDFRCECPVHDNGTHFMLTDKRGGKIEGHCMMGAKYDEWTSALALRGLWGDGPTSAPISTNGETMPRPKKFVHEYAYRNRDGEVVAYKGRFTEGDKKTFLWRMDSTDWKGLTEEVKGNLPLYRGELVTEGCTVWFVEGEKAADKAADHGLTAVCGYAGAGTKFTPEMLAPLEGCRVIIWPDNDEPGRTMAIRLKGMLEGAQILPDVGLPEHGDAYDYFEGGGTVERLLEVMGAVRHEPWVEKSDKGHMVSFPDVNGTIRFLFEDVTQNRHQLEADVTVRQEGPGVSREPFKGRLNLLSLNNRTEFRRNLDEVFDRPKGFWAGILNRAVTMVQQAIAEHDPSMRIQDAPDVRDDGYIVHPILASTGPTIWFGDGGVGKSFQALALCRAVCEGGQYLGFDCAWRGVIYIDYETDAATIKSRLRDLGGVPEDFYYWPGLGTPLHEFVPALQRKIAKDLIGLVVIDSAVPACGGEPEKADTARQFFGAVSKLGIPTLTVSHVTKAGEDNYPFGSVMWNNLARLTWNVKSSQAEGESVLHVGLWNRKSNNDRKHKPIGVKVTFDATGVDIRREEIQGEELEKHLSLPVRIRKILNSRERSLREMAEDLDVGEGRIRVALTRMGVGVVRRGKAPDGTSFWGLTGVNNS